MQGWSVKMFSDKCEFCHKTLNKTEIAICAGCKKANEHYCVWKGMPTRFGEQIPPLQKNQIHESKKKVPNPVQQKKQSKKKLMVQTSLD
jgi:hypothetical protein